MKQMILDRGPGRPGRIRPAGGNEFPQVYEWSQYQPDRQIDFNGHYFQAAPGQQGVLVDPVPFQPGDREQIESLGGVEVIVLTNGDHVREAAVYRQAFGCPLLVPRADLERASVPDAKPYQAGDRLPGELQAVQVPDNKSPGETALYHAGTATLIVGDAVIGKPMGRLSLLADKMYPDPLRAARGLRALLAHPLNYLLIGDGQSILHEPAAAILNLIYERDPAAFLIGQAELFWQEPWSKGERFAGRSAEYSRLLGLRVLDFDLTSVPPGKQSVPLHRHDGEEEVFLIMSGQGEVLTDRGNFPVQTGDVLAFPPRYQIAHAFRNTGDQDLRFLAFSAPAETLEMVDYPESGKRLEMAEAYGKLRRFRLPQELNVPYWAGEQID